MPRKKKDLTTGFSYKYYVHWKDDCSYELSFWETNDPKFEDDKKKLTITLVKTAGDTYFYESTLEGGYSQRSGKLRR